MLNTNPSWLLMVTSLPSTGATARMRLWRAVKTLGCAALRDGAYLLPASDQHAAALTELAALTNAEGGQALVVDVTPRSADDHAAFMALFDRSGDYADLVLQLNQARKGFASQTPAEVSRAVKRFRKDLDAIERTDFFPNEASLGAQAAWSDLQDAANAVLSPGEPQSEQRVIAQLAMADYQGRTWATRRHLWVDRIASAWLIQRFIDRQAKFLWLDSPADCPSDALGFDFDDAAFTHIEDKVTFEVLLASFGLDDNEALSRLAAVVHALDVGGANAPEALGFEAILSGARARLPDDDALLAEIGAVLDSLYTHFEKRG
jgi:hypothetical protein